MWIVLSLLVVALAVVPTSAQDRLDALAAAVDRATATPAGETASVERMAKFLDSTPDVLRASRASSRLGWGDVFIAHRIANRGGHPLERVFAARRTGTAWGEIAEEARVEPEALVQDLAAVWPDAARAVPGPGATRPAPPAAGDAKPADAKPAAAPPVPEDEKKGFGSRVLDLFRGSPSDTAADAPPSERPQDEIRDRMIRGSGGRTR